MNLEIYSLYMTVEAKVIKPRPIRIVGKDGHVRVPGEDGELKIKGLEVQQDGARDLYASPVSRAVQNALSSRPPLSAFRR